MSERTERFSPGQRLRYIGKEGWPKYGIAAGALCTYVGPDEHTRRAIDNALKLMKLLGTMPPFDSDVYKEAQRKLTTIVVEFDDVPGDADERTVAPEDEFVPLDDDEKLLDGDIRHRDEVSSHEEFIRLLGIDIRTIEVTEEAAPV